MSDTVRSISFYQNKGFSVVKRQLNRGIEQARLDGLEGAFVEVTALETRANSVPHLELLCYQRPQVLSDAAAADDPRSTRLVLVRDLEDGSVAAQSGDVVIAEMSERDPDGHLLVFRDGLV